MLTSSQWVTRVTPEARQRVMKFLAEPASPHYASSASAPSWLADDKHFEYPADSATSDEDSDGSISANSENSGHDDDAYDSEN